MNLHSMLSVSAVLLCVVVWIFRSFTQGKLNSGQTLFWLTALAGAEVLTLFPSLVDVVNVLWGNLVPVSWISFAGISCLIIYLLYQSTQINRLESRLVSLARAVAVMNEPEIPPQSNE